MSNQDELFPVSAQSEDEPKKKVARKTAAKKTAAKKTARKTAAKKTATKRVSKSSEPVEGVEEPKAPARESRVEKVAEVEKTTAISTAPVKKAVRRGSVRKPASKTAEETTAPEPASRPKAPTNEERSERATVEKEAPKVIYSFDPADEAPAEQPEQKEPRASSAEDGEGKKDEDSSSNRGQGRPHADRRNRWQDRQDRRKHHGKHHREGRDDQPRRDDQQQGRRENREHSQENESGERSGHQDNRGQNRGNPQHNNHNKQNRSDQNRSGSGGNNPQQGGGQNKKNRKFDKNFHKDQRKKGKKKRGRFFDNADDSSPVNYGELPGWEIFGQAEEFAALVSELKANEAVSLNELLQMNVPALEEWAKQREITLEGPPNRKAYTEKVFATLGERKIPLLVEGLLELPDDDDDFGLLVYDFENYRSRSFNTFVAEQLISKHGLKSGHWVKLLAHAPRENESCPFAVEILEVNGMTPEAAANLTPFEELIPYYPLERMLLEAEPGVKWDNISMRVIDLLTPIGLGQRGLIVAPPRTGKTVVLQGLANAIVRNQPDAHLIILLIDERPEEVTDFKRSVQAEVISSTFDESAESHVRAAEMVIEKSRRMVEAGRDVVILLDSITRLARAYNTMMPNSGKILSGGVEASALQKPKRFFGSARNIEGGGSLTILGTALIETGSRMDEVIFEEFKGTGNMELHLDRALADKRIFPAINLEKSGTRKEELLYHPDEMNKIFSLRRAMKGVPSPEAMEMLIQRVKKTKTNIEFLMTIGR